MRRWIVVISLGLAALWSDGCHQQARHSGRSVDSNPQKVFVVSNISRERAGHILSELSLGTARPLADGRSLSVAGSPSQLERASVVLQLVDTEEEFMVEALAPAAEARRVPSNTEIAGALADIVIGTFAKPPPPGVGARGIIDIHDDAVIAIVPVRFRRDLLTLAELGIEGFRELVRRVDSSVHATPEVPESTVGTLSAEPQLKQVEPTFLAPVAREDHEPASVQGPPSETSSSEEPTAPTSTSTDTPVQPSDAVESTVAEGRTSDVSSSDDLSAARHSLAGEDPKSDADVIVLGPGDKQRAANEEIIEYELAPLANGDDTLELDLPEKIDLIHLLDLAAEYLHLDYIYESDKIQNEQVTLKLHGKLQGEIRMKDLYPLLESILKFKGLVMTRRRGGLVTIVPVDEALEVDPLLVDPTSRTIETGNTAVTRVFDLRHIEASSAANLLENMRLGVAVSPIDETRTLIVTCYAHRMGRIERLLSLVDRVGRPRMFRSRQLKYTMAKMLIQKVETLAQELQNVSVAAISARSTVSGRPGAQVPAIPIQRPSVPTGGGSAPRDETVYLDADERRNRVLMVGYEEQLAIIDELIDVLDVAQKSIQTIRVYSIERVDAHEIYDKLEDLGIVGRAGGTTTVKPAAIPSSLSKTESARAVEGPLVERPHIVVLEATNSLLIRATDEQHEQIAAIIGYIDVTAEDLRTLRVYAIENVDAEEVVKKLSKLQIIGGTVSSGGTRRTVGSPVSPPTAESAALGTTGEIRGKEAQLVVLEPTNSLLIYATERQHAQIAEVIDYVDTVTREEAIPYEIYFLENQDPENLAEVLGQLIQETVRDKEGKVEEVIRRTDEQIVIIPDKGTFSLIVYASRKNQEWIAKLVKQLDKRRPQVLIDATLVEITKTEAFTYDLNLIRSFPDLTSTSGLTGTLVATVPGEPAVRLPDDIVDGLSTTGRSRFVDLQSDSGEFTGFYGDVHINALLEAMQSKNYGRVLAKPKILVNDNEAGTIKTTDTTYVEIASAIPISSGGTNEATLVQTELQYESYEAGITLDITPHISEGDLLRLDIKLTRSDFLRTADSERPPDTRANDVETTVTVPDGSTIILGGLLKFNQNKGGTKVPILGDIPLVGGLFRSINNEDTQSKLYIFVKAEILRPSDTLAQGLRDLEAISERDRQAFEKHEEEFQSYEDWPGVKPKPVDPERVLEAR